MDTKLDLFEIKALIKSKIEIKRISNDMDKTIWIKLSIRRPSSNDLDLDICCQDQKIWVNMYFREGLGLSCYTPIDMGV